MSHRFRSHRSGRARPFRARSGVRLGAFFALGVLAAGGLSLARRPAGGGSPGPPDPEALEAAAREYNRGQDLFAAERYPEAFEAYARAARLAPGEPRPYHGLGKVYRKLVLEERAAALFREALRADPSYLPARKDLAMALYELGAHQEALALLEETEKLRPGDPFVWAEQALNRLRLGRVAEAVRLLERYNAAEGKQAWGSAHLGRAHAEAGDPQAAEKAYREAIDLDPAMVTAYLWLGQLLVAAGRRAEAERFFTTFRRLRELQTREHSLRIALLRAPRTPGLLAELARVRMRLGRTEEGLKVLAEAVRLAPRDEGLRRRYERFRELEREEEALARALEASPEDADLLVKLARVRMGLGKAEAGLALLEKAVALRPGDARLRELHEGASRAVEAQETPPAGAGGEPR